MATNFPASLDTLTNPTSSDSLSSPSHSAQHANANDAIEALQAKVGADSSAVATSHDYKIAALEGRDTAGLVFISRTTVGSAVSSVTVSGAFSSDYDNYRVVFAGSVGSANLTCAMRLGATASGYKYAIRQNNFAGSGGDVGSTSASELALGGIADSAGSEGHFVVDVCGPNLAHGTSVTSMNVYGHPTVGRLDIFGGLEPSSTQHTAFTLLATTGTMTGGTIDVYGYAKA